MSYPPDPTMPGPVAGPPGGFGGGPQFSGPPQGPPSGGGANPALIIGILLLVAGLIGGGAFFLMSEDDEKDDDSEETSSSRENDRGGDNDRECMSQQQSDDEAPADGGEGDSGSEAPAGDSESDGEGSGQAEEGCAPSTDASSPEIPEVPDVDVEVPDVEVPDVEVPEDNGGGSSSGGDVVTAFAIEIYENTPQGVLEDDAICLSESVIAVVGESTVVSSDFDPGYLYSNVTSTSEDAEIAGLAYSCTTTEADSALRDEVAGYWPDAWNPGS